MRRSAFEAPSESTGVPSIGGGLQYASGASGSSLSDIYDVSSSATGRQQADQPPSVRTSDLENIPCLPDMARPEQQSFTVSAQTSNLDTTSPPPDILLHPHNTSPPQHAVETAPSLQEKDEPIHHLRSPLPGLSENFRDSLVRNFGMDALEVQQYERLVHLPTLLAYLISQVVADGAYSETGAGGRRLSQLGGGCSARNLRPVKFLLLEVSRTIEDTLSSQRFMDLPVLTAEQLECVERFRALWDDLHAKLHDYVQRVASESVVLGIIAAKGALITFLNEALVQISETSTRLSGLVRLTRLLTPSATPKIADPADADQPPVQGPFSLKSINRTPWDAVIFDTRVVCLHAASVLYLFATVAASAQVAVPAVVACSLLFILYLAVLVAFRMQPQPPSPLSIQRYFTSFGVLLSLSSQGLLLPAVPTVSGVFEPLWVVFCLVLELETVQRAIYMVIHIASIAAFAGLRIALVQDEKFVTVADPDIDDGGAGWALWLVGRILGVVVTAAIVEFLHVAAASRSPVVSRTLRYEQQYRLTALAMIDNYMNENNLEACLRDVNHTISALLTVAQTVEAGSMGGRMREESFATSIISRGLNGLRERIDNAFSRSPMDQSIRSVRTNATTETRESHTSLDVGGVRRSRSMNPSGNPLAAQGSFRNRSKSVAELSNSRRSDHSASPKQTVSKIRTLLGGNGGGGGGGGGGMRDSISSLRLSPTTSDLRRAVPRSGSQVLDASALLGVTSSDTRPPSSLEVLRSLVVPSQRVDAFAEQDGALFLRLRGQSFYTQAAPMLGSVALLAIEIPDMMVVYWSPKLEHLTGFRRETIEKRSLLSLIDDESEQSRLERACAEAVRAPGEVGQAMQPLTLTLRGESSETVLTLTLQQAHTVDDAAAGTGNPIVIATGRDLGFEHLMSQYLSWLFDAIRSPIQALALTSEHPHDLSQYYKYTQQLVKNAKNTLARFEPLCAALTEAGFRTWTGVNLRTLLEKVLCDVEAERGVTLTLDFPDDVNEELFLDYKRTAAVVRSLVLHTLQKIPREEDVSACSFIGSAGYSVVLSVLELRTSVSSTLRISVRLRDDGREENSRTVSPATAFTIDKTSEPSLITPMHKPSYAASSSSMADMSSHMGQTVRDMQAYDKEVFSPQTGPDGLAMAHVRLIIRQMGGSITYSSSANEFVMEMPCMYATLSDQPAQPEQPPMKREFSVTALLYVPSIIERRFVLQAVWKQGLSTNIVDNPVDVDSLSMIGIDIIIVSHGQPATEAIVTKVLSNKQLREVRVMVLRSPEQPLIPEHAKLYDKKRVLTVMQPIRAATLNETLRRLQDEIADKKKKIQDEATLRKTFGNGHSCPWGKQQKLGKGAFSEVYKAVNMLTNGLMAVKIISLDGKSESAVMNMVNEIQLLSDHRHENIIHYFYCERTASELHIFMEYSPGGSLNDLIMAYELLDPNTTVCCLVDVLSAVRYLHSQNVIHRDIKSANILLTADGTCKLSDFGCAIQVGQEHVKKFIGTPSYMAPEVVNEKPYTCVVDCWSIGVLTFEMLTGTMVWREVGGGNVNWMRISQHIGKLDDDGAAEVHLPEDSNVGSEERSFILLCLTVDPDKRATSEELMKHSFLSTYSRDDIYLPVIEDDDDDNDTAVVPAVPSALSSVLEDNLTLDSVAPAPRRMSVRQDSRRASILGLGGTRPPSVSVKARAPVSTAPRPNIDTPPGSQISLLPYPVESAIGTPDVERSNRISSVSPTQLPKQDRSEMTSASSSTSSNSSVLSFVSKSNEVDIKNEKLLGAPRRKQTQTRSEIGRVRSPSHSPRGPVSRKSSAHPKAEAPQDWTIDDRDDEDEELRRLEEDW